MDTDKKTRLYAYLALILGILAIGFSAIFVRVAGAPGPVTSFYRMSIAAAVLAIPFILKVKARRGLPFFGVRMAVFAGLFFGLDLASWATGVVLSGATNPTLLANTAPVWVGLGAWVFFKEKQTLGFWGGLVVALTGATLILGVEAFQSADLGRGSFYGLLAGVFYGVHFLFSQRGREYLDALSFIWISSFTSGVVLFVFTILLKQPLFGYPTKTYLIFLALGLVVQVLGWFAIAFAQGHLPASLVAPTMLGQPVMTAILAVPLLGERITMWEALGGVAVLIGVYIVHRSRRN